MARSSPMASTSGRGAMTLPAALRARPRAPARGGVPALARSVGGAGERGSRRRRRLRRVGIAGGAAAPSDRLGLVLGPARREEIGQARRGARGREEIVELVDQRRRQRHRLGARTVGEQRPGVGLGQPEGPARRPHPREDDEGPRRARGRAVRRPIRPERRMPADPRRPIDPASRGDGVPAPCPAGATPCGARARATAPRATSASSSRRAAVVRRRAGPGSSGRPGPDFTGARPRSWTTSSGTLTSTSARAMGSNCGRVTASGRPGPTPSLSSSCTVTVIDRRAVPPGPRSSSSTKNRPSLPVRPQPSTRGGADGPSDRSPGSWSWISTTRSASG